MTLACGEVVNSIFHTYENKVNLQNMLFPEGIWHNRKKQHYRTQRINSFLGLNNLFSERYKGKDKKRETILYDFPSKVVPHGLEPWTP